MLIWFIQSYNIGKHNHHHDLSFIEWYYNSCLNQPNQLDRIAVMVLRLSSQQTAGMDRLTASIIRILKELGNTRRNMQLLNWHCPCNWWHFNTFCVNNVKQIPPSTPLATGCNCLFNRNVKFILGVKISFIERWNEDYCKSSFCLLKDFVASTRCRLWL